MKRLLSRLLGKKSGKQKPQAEESIDNDTKESIIKVKQSIANVLDLLKRLEEHFAHISTLVDENEKKRFFLEFNRDVEILNRYVKILKGLALNLVNGEHKYDVKGEALNRQFLSKLNQLDTVFHKIGIVGDNSIQLEIKKYKKIFGEISYFFQKFKY